MRAAVGSIAPYFHPSLWGTTLHSGIDDMGRAPFWAAVAQIIFINILLSGDNAVVIAMACRDLPQRQKFWGLIIGAAAAVVLRLLFTGVVGELMLQPYLKLVGGLLLIYVAAKLVVPEHVDKSVETVAQLWRAVRIVVVADIVMSLDNVIAVAAIAQGSLVLLAIGLAASVPIIIAGAALISLVLDRFPIFTWAGAALLGWIAGDVIATDPAVTRYISAVFGTVAAHHVEFAASCAAAFLVVGIGGLWRNLSLQRIRTRSSKEQPSGS